MEIRKTAISNLPLGTLVRQRDAVTPAARPENGSRKLDQTISGSAQEPLHLSADELQAAMNALERRAYRAAGEPAASESAAELGGRARRAVNAYLTQQNLPLEEGNSALSAMLGVDYFA
jgi:hypothetical protein